MVSDRVANIPDFARDLHSLIGRALNAKHGELDGLWDKRPTNYLDIESAEDTFRCLVYLITNPVRSCLVKTCREYPGLVTLPGQAARTTFAMRPRLKLFKRSKMRPMERLTLTVPPALSHLTPVQFRQELASRVAVQEALLQEKAKAEGKTFLGRRALLRMRRDQPPKTRERGGRLIPSIAESNRKRRIERLIALKVFRQLYCIARRAWLDGDPDALFPVGTFQLRGCPGVVVDAPRTT